MRLGVFARTFSRSSLEGVFDALVGYGLGETQFNMSVAGMSPLPEEIAPALADRVRAAAAGRQIILVAPNNAHRSRDTIEILDKIKHL